MLNETEFKFGVPNKGSLFEGSVTLLQEAGVSWGGKEGQLVFPDALIDSRWTYTSKKFTLAFRRPQDIVREVASGRLDMGIVGGDLVKESRLKVKKIASLGFGECQMVLEAPAELYPELTETDFLPTWPPYYLERLRGKTVATSFPNITFDFFGKYGIPIQIYETAGATEGSPALGVSDVVVDLVETGATMEANELIINFPFKNFEALWIANPSFEIESYVNNAKEVVTDRLGSALLARGNTSLPKQYTWRDFPH